MAQYAALQSRIELSLCNRFNNSAQSTGESCLPQYVNINNPPSTNRDYKQQQPPIYTTSGESQSPVIKKRVI